MIDWLYTNALAALVLAVVATAAIWFMRPSPAVRHALWLVVVLKLVSPAGITIEVPLPYEPAPAEPIDVLVSEEQFTVTLTPSEGQSIEEAAAAALAPAVPAAAEVPPPPPWWAIDLRPWLLGVWGLGAAVIALRQARSTRKFARFASQAVPADRHLIAEVAAAAARMGVRAPEVRLLAGLTSPVLWCLTRPVLLWPVGLDGKLSADGRRAVIAHELAHLRRRDHWSRRLEMVASVLHWWNPLFWLARRRLRADAELACDAWAAGQVDRRAYAEALLAVCSFHSRRRPAAAVGVAGEGRREMQQRLTMIMRDQGSCRLAFGGKLVVALMVIAALPAWTLGQAKTDPAVDPQVQALEQQLKSLAEKIEALKAVKKAQNVKPEGAVDVVREFTFVADPAQAGKDQRVDVTVAGDKPVVRVVDAEGKEVKNARVVVVTEGKEMVVQSLPGGTKVVQGVLAKPSVTVTGTAELAKPGNGLRLNVTPVQGPEGKEFKIEGVRVTQTGDPVKADNVKQKVTTIQGKEWKVEGAKEATGTFKLQEVKPVEGKSATWAFTEGKPLGVAIAPDGKNLFQEFSVALPTSGQTTITLSRASYKVGKPQTAAALAGLLGEIKATVMEVKVDGESVVVTTTPEAQKAVGDIVRLISGQAGQAGAKYSVKWDDKTTAKPAIDITPAKPATEAKPAKPATVKPAKPAPEPQPQPQAEATKSRVEFYRTADTAATAEKETLKALNEVYKKLKEANEKK